jgi:hypothetical protein
MRRRLARDRIGDISIAADQDRGQFGGGPDHDQATRLCIDRQMVGLARLVAPPAFGDWPVGGNGPLPQIPLKTSV